MMAAQSDIEWTDSSWTPIRARNRKTGKVGWHCEHATTGCEFCYAEGMNKRLGTGLPFKPGHRKDIEIFLDEEMLLAPLRWRKPRRIFVCSMSDLFADFVTDEWILRVLDVIRRTSWDGGSNCGRMRGEHTYQVLTKRAARMAAFMPRLRFRSDLPIGECALYLADDGKHPVVLKNLWLGVSCERQQEADERIPLLLQTPAAVRFISAEPLLGPINLKRIEVADHGWQDVLEGWRDCKDYSGRENILDWVIVGGESGPRARVHDIEWSRSLIAQCKTAGVAVFEKQLGSRPVGKAARTLNLKDRKGGDWSEWPEDLRVREFPNVQSMAASSAGMLTEPVEPTRSPLS